MTQNIKTLHQNIISMLQKQGFALKGLTYQPFHVYAYRNNIILDIYENTISIYDKDIQHQLPILVNTYTYTKIADLHLTKTIENENIMYQ